MVWSCSFLRTPSPLHEKVRLVGSLKTVLMVLAGQAFLCGMVGFVDLNPKLSSLNHTGAAGLSLRSRGLASIGSEIKLLSSSGIWLRRYLHFTAWLVMAAPVFNLSPPASQNPNHKELLDRKKRFWRMEFYSISFRRKLPCSVPSFLVDMTSMLLP